MTAARRVAAALIALGLSAAFSPVTGIAAPDSAVPEPPQVMDELVVTGEHTGPGMWHVHRGAANLWILGSMSPLPRGITWRSKQLEQLLDGTNQVVVPKPFEIGIARVLWLLITERSLLMVGGGKRLKDVMPPDLHARFALQRAKYTGDDAKWERFRPIIAAAFLQQAAFHRVGLSTRLDLGAAVRVLAKKHHVRIDELKIAGVHDVLDALKTMPPATENACVDASLATVEKDLPGTGVGDRQHRTHRQPAQALRGRRVPRGARCGHRRERPDRAGAAHVARQHGKIFARRRRDRRRGEYGHVIGKRRAAR